jgi:hypothetical protein
VTTKDSLCGCVCKNTVWLCFYYLCGSKKLKKGQCQLYQLCQVSYMLDPQIEVLQHQNMCSTRKSYELFGLLHSKMEFVPACCLPISSQPESHCGIRYHSQQMGKKRSKEERTSFSHETFRSISYKYWDHKTLFFC